MKSSKRRRNIARCISPAWPMRWLARLTTFTMNARCCRQRKLSALPVCDWSRLPVSRLPTRWLYWASQPQKRCELLALSCCRRVVPVKQHFIDSRSDLFMSPIRTIIMGAAGRDFHNFNVFFRDNPDYEVVAFTATQIPNIEGRKYPAELAGKQYPQGIAIYPESDLNRLIDELKA